MRMKRFAALLLALVITLTGLGLFASAAGAEENWISVWGSALVNGSVSVSQANLQDVILGGSTLRTRLTVTRGGTALRFVFSNQYGAAPITITEASVAKAGANVASVVGGTQTDITFDGRRSVSIPAGQRVISDDIEFVTEALEEISVSLYFDTFTYMTSSGLSNGRTFMQKQLFRSGSEVDTIHLPNAREVNITSGTITYHTIPFLERIESRSDAPGACAVFIGDSTLVNDTYLYYARRIVASGERNVSVINEAIIGNKLLSNGAGLIGNLYGQALIDRFRRDVLTIPGIKYCFIKIGLNDVLHQFSKSLGPETPKYTPEEIINGYQTLISLCHNAGIKIYLFTKSPWNGYARAFLGQSDDLVWSPEAQAMTDRLNDWILSQKLSDGVIDCSPLADPSDPTRLCPSFTPDGAHLTDLGSIALADLIPLDFVGVPASRAKSAASLTGVDPYKEKYEIIRRMNEATTARPAPTTAPNGGTPLPTQPNGSVLPTQPSVTVPYTTVPYTTVPTTTNPFTPSVTDAGTPAYVPNLPTTQPYEEPATVPYAEATTLPANGMNVIVDNRQPATFHGDGSGVFVLMVTLTVLSAAGVVTVLTLTKKKEEKDDI